MMREKSRATLRPGPFRAAEALLLAIICSFLAAADLHGAQVRVFPQGRYRRPVPTGSISGTVTLADGTPAAGARVMVQTSDGVSPRATTTDSHGRFRVKGLRRGPYDLRARAGGVWSDWTRHIRVRINEESSANLRVPASKPAAEPAPVKNPPAKKPQQEPGPDAQ